MAACNMLVKFLAILIIFQTMKCEDKVKIEILKDPPKDCTRKAKAGDVISMHYRGSLQANGKEFDSSYSRSQPFEFQLGVGNVIKGWEEGVPGMCIGEKRRLTIPSSLGYGDQGFGDVIPGKSVLVFEIELMDIKSSMSEQDARSHEHPDTFESIDTDGNKEISSEEMANYIKSFNSEMGDNSVEGTPEDSIDTMVSEIFQEDDKNKDGVISLEEFQHAGEGPQPEDDDEEEEPPEDPEDFSDEDFNDGNKEEL